MTDRASVIREADKSKVPGILESISPSFHALTADLEEIKRHSDNPEVLAALLFKLAEERKDANQQLQRIELKFDEIMLFLKTSKSSAESQPFQPQKQLELLPEADQKILDFVEKQGKVSTEEVQGALGYKGPNAASQRLNKLFREGYLNKVRSGKKVLFLAKA